MNENNAIDRSERVVSAGMEQGQARRRARELNGLAVSARNLERCKKWHLGGWAQADDVWIVLSLDGSVVLDDGERQNYLLGEVSS